MAIKLGYGSKPSGFNNPLKLKPSFNAIERVPVGLGTSVVGGALGPITSTINQSRQFPSHEEYVEAFGHDPLTEPERYPGQREYYKESLAKPPTVPDLTAQGLREGYSKLRGKESQSAEPQNILESGANYLGEQAAPLAVSVLLGNPLLQSVTKLAGARAGGAALRTGAALAGGGETAQNIADFAGNILGDFSVGRLGKPLPSRELFNREKVLRTNKIKELEKSRSKNYAQAEKVGKNIRENAPEVFETIKEVEQGSLYGVDAAERTKILDKLNQLESQLHDGKLSLNVAKQFKKNINSAIYDRNLTPTLQKYYGDINRGLNKFIARVGELHPEHGRAFAEAERQTVQLSQLKSPEVETYKEFVNRIHHGEQKVVTDAINETKPNVSDWTMSAIASGLGFLGGGYKAGAAAGALYKVGRSAGREFNLVRKILKQNPTLMKELKDAVVAAAKKDYPLFVSRIGNFDQDLTRKIENNSSMQKSELKLGY